MATTHFNPNQPRDAHGRWVKGVGAVKALVTKLEAEGKITSTEKNLAIKAAERHTAKEKGTPHAPDEPAKNLEHLAKKTREDAVIKGKAGDKAGASRLRKHARAVEAAINAASSKDKPTESKSQPKAPSSKGQAVKLISSTNVNSSPLKVGDTGTLTGRTDESPQALNDYGEALFEVKTKSGKNMWVPHSKLKATGMSPAGTEPAQLKKGDKLDGKVVQSVRDLGNGKVRVRFTDGKTKRYSGKGVGAPKGHSAGSDGKTRRQRKPKPQDAAESVTTEDVKKLAITEELKVGKASIRRLTEGADPEHYMVTGPKGFSISVVGEEEALRHAQLSQAKFRKLTTKNLEGVKALVYRADSDLSMPHLKMGEYLKGAGVELNHVKIMRNRLNQGLPLVHTDADLLKKMIGAYRSDTSKAYYMKQTLNQAGDAADRLEHPIGEGVDDLTAKQRESLYVTLGGVKAGFMSSAFRINLDHPEFKKFDQERVDRAAEIAAKLVERKETTAEDKAFIRSYLKDYGRARPGMTSDPTFVHAVAGAQRLQEGKAKRVKKKKAGEGTVYRATADGFAADLNESLASGGKSLAELDPTQRQDLPRGHEVGHGQVLLYDMAVGKSNGVEKKAVVKTNAEYLKEIEAEGVIDLEKVRKEVPLQDYFHISTYGNQWTDMLAQEGVTSHQVTAWMNKDPAYRQGSFYFPTNLSKEDELKMAGFIAPPVPSAATYEQGESARMARDRFIIRTAKEHPEKSLLEAAIEFNRPNSGRWQYLDGRRKEEANRKIGELTNDIITERRKKDGTVAWDYHLPKWDDVQLEDQNLEDLPKLLDSHSGSYIPAFYTSGVVEDGVLYHRSGNVTSARVAATNPDGDKDLTAKLKAEGAMLVKNSKNIDPGYKGRAPIYAGDMLLISEGGTEQKKASVHEAEARIFKELHSTKRKANFGRKVRDKVFEDNDYKYRNYLKALGAQVGRARRAKLEKSEDWTLEDLKAEIAKPVDYYDGYGAEGKKSLTLPKDVQDQLGDIIDSSRVISGGKRIEYVLHKQPGEGAPRNQRGRLTFEGYTPEEVQAKMQEWGMLGELEPKVPFKSIMRSERRDGLVLPLHSSYVRGEEAPPNSKMLITHGLTARQGQDIMTNVRSILGGGGLHSIAERYRRGIHVNSSSPAGDIRSGIDHVVFGSHDSGSGCGSSSAIRIAFRPDVMMRRDITLSDRDYGGMGSRYNRYFNYRKGLDARAGEVAQKSLFQPISPKARQEHLTTITGQRNAGSAEFNVGGSVPVEDMEVIACQSPGLKAQVENLLRELKREGRISRMPRVILQSDWKSEVNSDVA